MIEMLKLGTRYFRELIIIFVIDMGQLPVLRHDTELVEDFNSGSMSMLFWESWA